MCSSVRALISSRSNSASPPSTVSINRPCGVVVSAQASANDLKPAPLSPAASSTLSRSRVEPASLSSRVTSRTSPGPKAAIALANAFRSVTAPLIRPSQRPQQLVPRAEHRAFGHLLIPERSRRSFIFSILRISSAQRKPLWIRPSRAVQIC
jgi:hypothetical protein